MTAARNIQTRSDLNIADKIVHAVWDNFIRSEPTFVLRDMIVIEIAKSREAEREGCAKIADDMSDTETKPGVVAGLIAAAIRARGQT